MVGASMSIAFLALLVSARLGLALPAPQAVGVTVVVNGRASSSPPPLPLDEISASNTGAAALPTPTGPPKYVLLGIGFQNYTCNGSAYLQSLPSDGAVANLYDVTPQLSKSNIDTFSPTALKAFEACLAKTSCKPDTSSDFCEACHLVSIAQTDPPAATKVGFHFFDRPAGAQVPNFDISKYGDFISAKRAGDVKAPAGSYSGSNGLGAVDWLYLVSNDLGRTHGLSNLYRVETAGGVAPKTCSNSGQQVFIPYAAEYWLYG